MTQGLLSGFRALDLTGAKGYACGKILATLGVEVIKIEKPGGDPDRFIFPFCNNTPRSESSLWWLSFNTDKRSITLDIETDAGKEIFKKLVKNSDFVLESFDPGYLDNLGLGYKVLSQLNPRVILTSITSFGQTGPYSHLKGCELIYSALSGIINTTGDPDRAPLREGPDSATYRGNAAAALGSVMAHYYRQISGEGQQVDVSLFEVDANRLGSDIVLWMFTKQLSKRSGSMRGTGEQAQRQFWPCKDGYVFWTIFTGKTGVSRNIALSQWMDDEGIENPLKPLMTPEGIDMTKISRKELEILKQSIVTNLFMKHTKQEIMAEAKKRGVDINTAK